MSQEIVIEYCSFESLKIEPNSGRKEYNIASVGKRRHSDLTCPSRIRVTLTLSRVYQDSTYICLWHLEDYGKPKMNGALKK